MIIERTGGLGAMQNTALLRTVRILRSVLETCYHSNFIERPSANADVKNSLGVNYNNNVDFAVLADQRLKLKESEKKDKYLDLPRELKKPCNMKVTIIPIVIGALGTVTKGLLKRLEDLKITGQVETILATTLLRSVRILRRLLET